MYPYEIKLKLPYISYLIATTQKKSIQQCLYSDYKILNLSYFQLQALDEAVTASVHKIPKDIAEISESLRSLEDLRCQEK